LKKRVIFSKPRELAVLELVLLGLARNMKEVVGIIHTVPNRHVMSYIIPYIKAHGMNGMPNNN